VKKLKTMRSLEELWELEDRYPLVDSNPSGLLRWMLATGVNATLLSVARPSARRISRGRRPAQNGRS
jgi:hypothetical protein